MEVCAFITLEIEIFTFFLKEFFLYQECLKSASKTLANKNLFNNKSHDTYDMFNINYWPLGLTPTTTNPRF